MKHRFSAMMSQRKIVVFGSILVYVLLLSILLFAVWKGADPDNEAVFGSLEGRFLSDIVLTHDGETYYYRENEITNYLFIGSDRENSGTDAGYQNGAQADFLIMLSIDRINRTVTPVMLDVDTMTPVQTFDPLGQPSDSRVMQLCLAQTYSGVDCSGSANTSRAVEALLHGVKVDYCISVDISALSLANDAIGGVEVTLEDDFTEFDPAMIKGATIRLNGEQAACFVQSRAMVSDGATPSRMMRQQQYMSSFLMQLRQISKNDMKLPASLMDSLSGHVQSDTSLLVLLRDARNYKDYLWQPILTPEGSYTVDESGFPSFWVNDDGLQELILQTWFVKEEQ